MAHSRTVISFALLTLSLGCAHSSAPPSNGCRMVSGPLVNGVPHSGPDDVIRYYTDRTEARRLLVYARANSTVSSDATVAKRFLPDLIVVAPALNQPASPLIQYARRTDTPLQFASLDELVGAPQNFKAFNRIFVETVESPDAGQIRSFEHELVRGFGLEASLVPLHISGPACGRR